MSSLKGIISPTKLFIATKMLLELYHFHTYENTSSVAYQHGNTNDECSDNHKIHENLN